MGGAEKEKGRDFDIRCTKNDILLCNRDRIEELLKETAGRRWDAMLLGENFEMCVCVHVRACLFLRAIFEQKETVLSS